MAPPRQPGTNRAAALLASDLPTRLRPVLASARATLAPWLVARVLVGGALLAVALGTPGLRHTGDVRPASGLLVWDGGWYTEIARHGYPADDITSLRFFPLLPLLGRGAGYLVGGNITAGLLIVTGLASLGYVALLAALTWRETGDETAARRVTWLAALAPGAAVLVLPYTEAVAGLLAVGMFWCLRQRHPLAAAALGLLSGAVRPTGILLAAPAAVELLRDRPRSAGEWATRGLTVASPLLGTGCYLLWCAATYGDPLLPYSVQTRPDLRGGWAVSPLRGLSHNTPGGLDWRLTLLLLAVAAVLLVVAAGRLPLSYTVWTVLMVAAAVTSSRGHSVPRYLANTFPLLIAAALLIRSRSAFAGALTACAVGFVLLAAAGFTPAYVP